MPHFDSAGSPREKASREACCHTLVYAEHHCEAQSRNDACAHQWIAEEQLNVAEVMRHLEAHKVVGGSETRAAGSQLHSACATKL